MTTVELEPAGRAAVDAFGAAVGALFEAMAALDAAGVELAAALRGLPGHEPGVSLWDELPPTIRMLLG